MRKKTAYKVKWTDSALNDLANIKAGLKPLNPHAAQKVAIAIKKAGNSLKKFPARHELWLDGTRRFVVPAYPSYSVIYDIADVVNILTVWLNRHP